MNAPTKQETLARIDWNRSARSIVIDFEGEGPKRVGPSLPPLLLGALVPPVSGGKPRYHAWFLDEDLATLARQRNLPGKRSVASIDQAITEVLDLAEERGSTVVAFSDHEARIVQEFCSEQVTARFLAAYENVGFAARRMANRKGFVGDEKSLAELVRFLKKGSRSYPEPKGGAAEACRTIRKARSKSSRFRKWSPNARSRTRELLVYNQGDCRATRQLLRTTAWEFDGKHRSHGADAGDSK